MGVSLLGSVVVLPVRWGPQSLVAQLLGAGAGPLAAQAPSDTHDSTGELPRFTMRQLVLRRNDALMQIPGAWLRAAAALDADSVTIPAYLSTASRSGVLPLRDSALKSNSQHLMGLYRRAEPGDGISVGHRVRAEWRWALPRLEDRALPGPAYGTLIPEVTFTIEDGFPDVLTTRILAPNAAP